MSLHGHCNCGAVRVILKEIPATETRQTFQCRCTTCKRDSGSGGQYVTIVDEDMAVIEDPDNTKKMWLDTLTDSGKPAERWSCGNCFSPVYTTTPNMPGKLVIRMGLFDEVPPVVVEIYMRNRRDWEPAVEGASAIVGGPSGSA